MARHSKTVNIQLEAKADAQARADGPSCKKCRELVLHFHGKSIGVGCGQGHELDPNTCGMFRDASIANPLTWGGTLGSWVGRPG